MFLEKDIVIGRDGCEFRKASFHFQKCLMDSVDCDGAFLFEE